jgi:beta-phosphoglucomutase-like phosphatase (HAD superfamily)
VTRRPDHPALIFDLDGVIIDSNVVHTETWREYLRRFGRELPEDFSSKTFGRHNRDIVRALFGPELSAAEIEHHGAAKEALYRERVRPVLQERLVPGVAEFIEGHAGWPLGEFVLEHAGLRRFFRAVVDGHQVPRPKPDPEIYLRAAELLGAAPADCIIFEDSFSGVEAGRAAGARIVGVQTTHASLPGADLLIRDFRAPQLAPWLKAQRAHPGTL